MSSRPARDPAGLPTPIWGYNGITPARRSRSGAAASVVRQVNRLPACTRRWATRLAVDPPARVGVAAAVRRLRQRRHLPRLVQGLPVPEHPGRADALVPRPRRAPHGAERLLGLAGMYILHDDFEQALPACRRARYDVPLIIARRDLHRQGQLIFDDNERVAVYGRRHPRQRPALAGDEGQAADVPLPGPQRLDLALLRLQLEHRRPVRGGRARTAGSCRRRSGSATSGTAWPSATRSSSTSRSTRPASASCCATTTSCRTTSATTTPTRSWRSTSSADADRAPQQPDRRRS